MSAPINVDVCPVSFLSYLTNPLFYAVVYSYSVDVEPSCVNGKAPYRIYTEIYLAGYPYTGQVIAYVDNSVYDTFNVSGGILDAVLLVDPGKHIIRLETPDGNALEIREITASCR